MNMKQKWFFALFALVSVFALISFASFSALAGYVLGRGSIDSGSGNSSGTNTKGTENDFNLCGNLWVAAGELVQAPQTVAFGKFASGAEHIHYGPGLSASWDHNASVLALHTQCHSRRNAFSVLIGLPLRG
jgi:hypothetical protein